MPPTAETTPSTDWINPHYGEMRKLSTLLEANQALATRDFKTGLARVLAILVAHHSALRSTIVLVDDRTGHLALEAAAGAIDRGTPTVAYLGEGITSEVVRHGKPLIVPQMSREPRFPNGAVTRPELAHQELTYVSVPLAIDGKTVGALGIDLPYAPDRDYERTLTFFDLVGSMIAQATRIRQLVNADRQIPVKEHAGDQLELNNRDAFPNLVGNSRPIRDVYEQVAQVAPANTTVLLRGESGTGKELIAQAIHQNSLRRGGPFIKVSCAALPRDLIESELFGYEKGAFTGANSSKKGRFELADGGTLFLDEIGDLELTTQVKLLRVLQEREFERLGGTQTIAANVRLITSTNKNLEKAIEAGDFREDLYYRLNVFAIFVPPLRKRRADIPQLANHFLDKFSRQHRKKVKRLATPAIDMLICYHWPGNVRELENAIERSVVVCDTQVLHAHHLPPKLQTAGTSDAAINASLDRAREAFEKDVLQDALKSARGNRAKAARRLSTTRRVFNYKVKKYRIDWRRFIE